MFHLTLVIIACLKLADASVFGDRSARLRQLAGMTHHFPRILLDDMGLVEVCDDFGPADEELLGGSKCSCEQTGSSITARCEKKDLCTKPEVEFKYGGDFWTEVKVNFGDTLPDLQTDDVLHGLLHGNFVNCFEYSELYDKQAVCIADFAVFGDNPSCTITIGGVACTKCEFCADHDISLTAFDCTNIIEGEALDQCVSVGSSLDGTVLGFMNYENTLTDTCDGAVAWASTFVGLVLASSLSVLMM